MSHTYSCEARGVCAGVCVTYVHSYHGRKTSQNYTCTYLGVISLPYLLCSALLDGDRGNIIVSQGFLEQEYNVFVLRWFTQACFV